MPDLLRDVRPLLILALPLILAQTSMGFVDTLMVGGEVLGSTDLSSF
jgi:Na+-driven multidrug efflux pump